MEKYEIPEMEVIRFEAEDIITASANLLAICWDESESQEQQCEENTVREHSILELLGKILAVVGVIALILLVIFSERAEKQEALEKTSGVTETEVPTETTAPTATLVPTETPMPTETAAPTETPVPTEAPTPTEPPEEDGTIVLPFVPAT